MRRFRTILLVSALSLSTLASGPLAAQAREAEPRDDRGKIEVQVNDDRGGALEARHGADDPAGDNHGGNDDPQPHL